MSKRDRCRVEFLLNVLASTLATASVVVASPLIRVSRDTDGGAALRLGLPSNATSIRAGEMISERFSCMGRHYGYYADPDNDCQLFHVCLPVQFDDGRSATYKWSFVCPEDTIFNQETFTCSRKEDAIACEDSERFYNLNEDLGRQKQVPQESESSNEVDSVGVGASNMADHPVKMDRPMERPMRPADHSDLIAPTTDSSDEATYKYAAFTTIRY